MVLHGPVTVLSFFKIFSITEKEIVKIQRLLNIISVHDEDKGVKTENMLKSTDLNAVMSDHRRTIVCTI